MKPDWLLLTITDNGPAHWYRFHVYGVNMVFGDKGNVFSWSLHDLDDPRYDPHPSAPIDVHVALDRARRNAA